MKPKGNDTSTNASDTTGKPTPEREVRLCPDCDGDGYFIYLGSPGYFCPSFGNYLPTEKRITCKTCNGYGELDPWEDDSHPQPFCLDDEDIDELSFGDEEEDLPF